MRLPQKEPLLSVDRSGLWFFFGEGRPVFRLIFLYTFSDQDKNLPVGRAALVVGDHVQLVEQGLIDTDG